MTDFNLDYLTSFKDRHGKRRYYFRYRGQKFKLPRDPASAEFTATYARYKAQVENGTLGRDNVVFIAGTIGRVIEEYLVHQHGLLKHAESSQRNYRLYCDIIKREVGQFRIEDITPVAVRGLRDSVNMKHKASVADMCVMMVSALWKFASEFLKMPLGHNPTKDVLKLHKKKRITQRWEQEIVDRFVAAATPGLQLAFYLLWCTGQRQSDVVSMRWDQVRGDVIRIRQRKTGKMMWTPIDPVLKPVLDQTPRINEFILNSERGLRFASRAELSKAIKRVLKSIGAGGYTAHGLRVTAACEVKESGATNDEVKAFTGHDSDKSLAVYLADVDQEKMARAAVAKRAAARAR